MDFYDSLRRALSGRTIQQVKINENGVAGIELILAGGEHAEEGEEISVYFHGEYLGDLMIEITAHSRSADGI